MALALEKVAYSMVCVVVFGTAATKCENADVLKTVERFPNVTAIYSITDLLGDANLHCVTAEVTQFNAEERTAIYTWHLKTDSGNQATIVNHITAADSPFEVKVSSTPDLDNTWIATFPFAGKTCFILKGLDIEDVCSLWVSTDSVDNISEECLGENEKICGQGILLYNKITCDGNPAYD